MPHIRLTETLTCEQYIPRVRDLEARGACHWIVKCLAHNAGYEIVCDVPVVAQQEFDILCLP